MGSGISSSITPFNNGYSKRFIPEPSKPQLSDYTIGLIVGMGGFCKIKEIQRIKDKKWFALKISDLSPPKTIRDAQLVVNEITALQRLPAHPFITRLHASFREGSHVMMVMDLLPGGDLRLLLRLEERFTERQVAYIIGAIGSALHHIHLHRIIHRDVKPENIMFDGRGVPKLIDFGISYVVPASSTVCICDSRSGTEQYASPEACVPETHYHSYETDFWSLGVVMYELLFLRRPYHNISSQMLKYSSDTYHHYWRSLLSLHQEQHSHRSTSQLDSFLPLLTDTPLSIASNSISQGYFPSIHHLENIAQDLLIPIPNISSLDFEISESCRNLLTSLLDVRLDQRYGVGDRYVLFENHPWFTSQNISVPKIDQFLDIIIPNFERISSQLWRKYFDLNSELNHCNPHHSQNITSQPLTETVEEFIQKFQFIYSQTST